MKMEMLQKEGGGGFVDGHHTRQSRQQKEQVEHHGKEPTDERHMTESNLEHIWQSDKHKSGTCIRSDLCHREDGREDDETAHDGHGGVDDSHAACRLHQLGIVAEITGISAKTSHGDGK